MSVLVVSPQQSVPLQQRRQRSNEFSEAQREAFLDSLAETCNVRLSAERAGIAPPSLYRWRGRDMDFAAKWQAALRVGYERLESALLRSALRVAEQGDAQEPGWAPKAEGAAPFADMTVAQAMDLLHKHRANVTSERGMPISTRRLPTSAEVDALILERIAVLKRQQERVS